MGTCTYGNATTKGPFDHWPGWIITPHYYTRVHGRRRDRANFGPGAGPPAGHVDTGHIRYRGVISGIKKPSKSLLGHLNSEEYKGWRLNRLLFEIHGGLEPEPDFWAKYLSLADDVPISVLGYRFDRVASQFSVRIDDRDLHVTLGLDVSSATPRSPFLSRQGTLFEIETIGLDVLFTCKCGRQFPPLSADKLSQACTALSLAGHTRASLHLLQRELV